MLKLTFTLLIFLLSPTTHARSSAGIIPYACHEGTTYILLADHIKKKERGWGTFGGGARPGESIPQTAARELREETGCVFSEPTNLQLSQMDPSTSEGFSFYVWQVPYLDTRLIAHSECGTADERTGWSWIPLETLATSLLNNETHLVIPGTRQKIKLWNKSNRTLREALDLGLLKRDGSNCR